MDEKLVRYLLLEIAHTQTQLLEFRSYFEATRKHPQLTYGEFKEINDININKEVIEGMKKRAAHEGVSLDELLS
jgi:hypothetical protein